MLDVTDVVFPVALSRSFQGDPLLFSFHSFDLFFILMSVSLYASQVGSVPRVTACRYRCYLSLDILSSLSLQNGLKRPGFFFRALLHGASITPM